MGQINPRVTRSLGIRSVSVCQGVWCCGGCGGHGPSTRPKRLRGSDEERRARPWSPAVISVTEKHELGGKEQRGWGPGSLCRGTRRRRGCSGGVCLSLSRENLVQTSWCPQHVVGTTQPQSLHPCLAQSQGPETPKDLGTRTCCWVSVTTRAWL